MTTTPADAETIERRRYALPPGVEPAPDILDDDMPDPMFQHPFFFAIVELLTSFFWNTPGALVDGDGPVYYRNEDGVQTYVKPDCMVAFGVDPDYIYARNGYFIEEVEKPPDFVMEIGSTTTAGNDTGPKRDLYEWLGVQEYFGFDRTRRRFLRSHPVRLASSGWRVCSDRDDAGRRWRDLGLQRGSWFELPRREGFSEGMGPCARGVSVQAARI